MKKHLIAAAVAAAVAVPAMAQNVTLGGLIDVGVRSVSPTGAASGVAMSQSAVSTSNINITGSEDLGGGLRASFNLNSALTPSTGGLGGTTSADAAPVSDVVAPRANASSASARQNSIFSREASVSLSGGFGALTLGRTDTSQSEGVDTFVGQFGNMSYFPSGGEYGGDQANTVRYQLPTFVNGLTIQAGRSALDGDSTTDVDSFSASYAAGPFGLIVGYDNLGGAAPAKYMAYGLRYDAGFVSVGYASGKRDVKLTATDITNTALSFRAPLVDGVALHVALQTRKAEATGITGKSTALGLSKALSKRTTVFGIYEDTNKAAVRSMMGDWFQVSVAHTF